MQALRHSAGGGLGWRQGVLKTAAAAWRGSWRRLPQKVELESMASTNPLYDTEKKRDLNESGLSPALEGMSSMAPLMGEIDIEDVFEVSPSFNILRTPTASLSTLPQIVEPTQPDCGQSHVWEQRMSQTRPSTLAPGTERFSAVRQAGLDSSGMGTVDVPCTTSAGASMPGGAPHPAISFFEAKMTDGIAAVEREKGPSGHCPDGEMTRRKTVTFSAATESTTAEKERGLSSGAWQEASTTSQQQADIDFAGEVEPQMDAHGSSPGVNWVMSDFHSPFVSAERTGIGNLAPQAPLSQEGGVRRGSLQLPASDSYASQSTGPTQRDPLSRAPLVTRYTGGGGGPSAQQRNTVAANVPLKAEGAGNGEATVDPPPQRQSMATAISELKVQSRRLSLLSVAQTSADRAIVSIRTRGTDQVAAAANDTTGSPHASSAAVPRLQLDRLLQEPTGASAGGEPRPQLSSWRPLATSMVTWHGDDKEFDAAFDTSVSPRDRKQSPVGSGSSPCNWLEGSGPSCSDLSPDHAVVCPDLGSESDNADAQHWPRPSGRGKFLDERQGSGGVQGALRGRGASWAPDPSQTAPGWHPRRGTNFGGTTYDARAFEGPAPAKLLLLPTGLPVANPSSHSAHQDGSSFPTSPRPSSPQKLTERTTVVALSSPDNHLVIPETSGEGRRVDDTAFQNLDGDTAGNVGTQQRPSPSSVTLERATWGRGPGLGGSTNPLASGEPSHLSGAHNTLQVEAPANCSRAPPNLPMSSKPVDTYAGVRDVRASSGNPIPPPRASSASRGGGGLLPNATHLKSSEYSPRGSRGAEALLRVSLKSAAPNNAIGDEPVPQNLPHISSGKEPVVHPGTPLRPQMSLPASGTVSTPGGIRAGGIPRLPLERDRSVDLVALRKMGLLGAAKFEAAQPQGTKGPAAGQPVHVAGKLRELGRFKSGLGPNGGILESYKSAIELGCLAETGGNPISSHASRLPRVLTRCCRSLICDLQKKSAQNALNATCHWTRP